MEPWMIAVMFLLLAAAAILSLIALLAALRSRRELHEELSQLRGELLSGMQSGLSGGFSTLSQSQQQVGRQQDLRLSELTAQTVRSQDSLRQELSERLHAVETRFGGFSQQNEQQLQGIRTMVSQQLNTLRTENAAQLEQMRQTVDEKLQKTLEERLGQSFAAVSTRLEQVHRGLGEMQNLAVGVGDLKRALTNVKTRGVWGEASLGGILEQILTPEQYEKNVATRPGSREVVEFAVRLPGEERPVWLPIDAKFPLDAYNELIEASEGGDRRAIEQAQAALLRRLDGFAKDVHDKYVSPPDTTDFAILYLPTESLYAEVVRLGAVERLQTRYRVSLAGPTTMAALLNSLQMGFRTLAIERRSAEVWTLLGAVRTEFDRFGEVLSKARQRLSQADSELELLVGRRSNAIARRLRQVESLPQELSGPLLEQPGFFEAEAEEERG